MINLNIEGLLKRTSRERKLPPLKLNAQISAVTDLVTVTHQQLVANQIDRDASSDMPARDHRFDAFFSVPEFNGVMSITSNGLPDVQGGPYGLFLCIHNKNDEGKPIELVGIQTVKTPEQVGVQEAIWLSGYTPEQLKQIAEIVRTASPVTPETYKSYFQEPVVPAGIEM